MQPSAAVPAGGRPARVSPEEMPEVLRDGKSRCHSAHFNHAPVSAQRLRFAEATALFKIKGVFDFKAPNTMKPTTTRLITRPETCFHSRGHRAPVTETSSLQSDQLSVTAVKAHHRVRPAEREAERGRAPQGRQRESECGLRPPGGTSTHFLCGAKQTWREGSLLISSFDTRDSLPVCASICLPRPPATVLAISDCVS